MPITEIYIKLVVDYADDPKVAALARFGYPDAGLCREMFIAMICYCRRVLTDGFVPAEQVARLVYPASSTEAEQHAKQLVQVGLIKEISKNGQPGYHVFAYCKRNGTRKSVEELANKRAEAGRISGQIRRSRTRGKQHAQQNRTQTETETETETEITGTGSHLTDPPFP